MARYMMATKAIHKLGDISRKEADLCVIYSEDAENYIGNWATGFGFINVEFSKSTTRDLTDEEKEKYHGRQIVIGGSPVSTIYTKDATQSEISKKILVLSQVVQDFIRPERILEDLKEELQKVMDAHTESPVIVLSDDETRKQQLRDKLVEYKGRMHPYRAPELQMGTICKIAVLERLLADGKVVTWDLSREMAETYGSGLNINDFQNACGVIEDYCKTGGQNLQGGIGLRAPEQMDSKRLRPGYPPMGHKVRIAEAVEVYGYQLNAGMVGTVNEGAYCGGIFDYTLECPVQFDSKKHLPETLGVPWGILEFAD